MPDAWTEQMREKERDHRIPISEVPFAPVERAENEKELELREESMETLADSSTPKHHSFFVTNRQVSIDGRTKVLTCLSHDQTVSSCRCQHPALR